MSSLKIWLLASRPKTLWAAVAPVLMGTAIAIGDHAWHWPSAVAALLGAILIQIGTNFANDYFDFRKGVDEGPRLGPMRVTQAGLVKPGTMLIATCLVFGLAMLIGVYLVARGGWPIVWIGLSSILLGFLYTAGPYPLGYNGLGDIFVLIFFGPIAVGGTYYVQAQSWDTVSLVAGLGPGLFSVAILTVNNLRDIDSDRAAGKRTLSVRFGRTFSRLEYLLSVLIASLLPLGMFFVWRTPLPAVATWIVALVAIPTFRTVFSDPDGEVFNSVLATTGKLLLLYAMLFSIGWLL